MAAAAAGLALAAWNPVCAWWSDAAGNKALLRGDVPGALGSFDGGLRREPGWSVLHEDRGRALLATDPGAALAEFDRAACGPACLAESGDAFVRLGRLDEAVDRYIAAKAVSRVDDLAVADARQGRYDEATTLEGALIARLHDDFLERADLAAAYATLGAIRLDAATAARPQDARSLRNAAIAAFGSASQLAPFNEGYLLSYAFSQMRWGDKAVARRAFERVLQLHPHQADAQAALPGLGAGPAPTPAPAGSAP